MEWNAPWARRKLLTWGIHLFGYQRAQVCSWIREQTYSQLELEMYSKEMHYHKRMLSWCCPGEKALMIFYLWLQAQLWRTSSCKCRHMLTHIPHQDGTALHLCTLSALKPSPNPWESLVFHPMTAWKDGNYMVLGRSLANKRQKPEDGYPSIPVL